MLANRFRPHSGAPSSQPSVPLLSARDIAKAHFKASRTKLGPVLVRHTSNCGITRHLRFRLALFLPRRLFPRGPRGLRRNRIHATTRTAIDESMTQSMLTAKHVSKSHLAGSPLVTQREIKARRACWRILRSCLARVRHSCLASINTNGAPPLLQGTPNRRNLTPRPTPTLSLGGQVERSS